MKEEELKKILSENLESPRSLEFNKRILNEIPAPPDKRPTMVFSRGSLILSLLFLLFVAAFQYTTQIPLENLLPLMALAGILPFTIIGFNLIKEHHSIQK